MRVIKRDGTSEKLDISKIRKQINPACEGLSGVAPEELELDLAQIMKDGISSKEIQKALIEIAMNKADVDRPNWVFVAARLALYDLYHEIKHKYNKAVSGNVYELITLETYLDAVFEKGRTKYSSNDFRAMGFDTEKLQKEIIKRHKNDLQFTIYGLNILMGRYLLKDENNQPIELPQHMFMHIAMMLAIPEKKEERTKWAIEFYKILTAREAMVATPTLGNLRKKFSNCFSCYVGVTADNLEGIMDAYKEQAIISKWGGGLGWDYSLVRSLGGVIQGIKGLAKGKVPWLKIENDLMIAVDQLGARPGSLNAYVTVWDKDVFDFLDVKKSGGEERRTCEDLFISLIADDVFMKQNEINGDWWLFDPYDVPKLNQTWGKEFEEAYWEYVKQAETNPESFTNPPVKIKARDVMRAAVKYMNDVGMPFMFFKDNVNRANRNPDEGIIRTSNLCEEIAQPTTPDETAICNLGSINLAKVNTKEDIERVVPLLVRMLDNVNDVTDYLMEKHESHQKRTRAIGLGVMGEAELVATKQIMFGSEEHQKLDDELYAMVYGVAEETSRKLAEEKGEWKEGKGMRNAYVGAIAPTSSISHVCGTTASHEPVFKRLWYEDGIFGVIPVVAPNLNSETYMYYVNAYGINQRNMLKLTSIRQKYVDQSISHNMYYIPEEITAKTIFDNIMYAWKNGVKTIYYTRTKSRELIKESDGIHCFGCE